MTVNTLRLLARAAFVLTLSFSSSFVSAQVTSPHADVPHLISYQGLLTTKEGKLATDSTYKITASLYTDATGSSELWHEQFSVITHHGVFNIELGRGRVPLPASSELSRPLWIGVTMEGNPRTSQLTALSASPYALAIADQSVTKEKMGTDYIRSLTVNGLSLSAPAAELRMRGSGVSLDKESGDVIIGSPQMPTWDGANGGTTNTSLGNDDFIGGGKNNKIAFFAPGNFSGLKNAIVGGEGRG